MTSVIKSGATIRRENGENGTLGCIVESRDGAAGKYILSNAHVMAFSGTARAEKRDCVFIGDDCVAKLHRWTKLLKPVVRMDVAIAELTDQQDFDADIVDLGMPRFNSAVQPALHQHVRFRGSGGQIVTGTIADLDLPIQPEYLFPLQGIRKVNFVEQVLINYDRQHEDRLSGYSGSLVVDEQNFVLGLFWGGSSSQGVFSRISNVFDEFNVQLAVPAAAIAVPVSAHATAVDVLARTIWGEARGEIDDGKKAVASVVVNRATRIPKMWWGATVEGVCRKPQQFSCWNENDPNSQALATADSDPDFPACLRVAEQAAAGRLPDSTIGATHYHTRAVHPNWSAHKTPCAEIGNHVFYNNIE